MRSTSNNFGYRCSEAEPVENGDDNLACETRDIRKMSHTHLLYHLVFGTKDRMPLISHDWEAELYKYLGGIIRGSQWNSYRDQRNARPHAHFHTARTGRGIV